MNRNCVNCGESFVVDRRGNLHKKYCSISCANSHRTITDASKKKIAETISSKSRQRYKNNPKLCVICDTPIPYESRFKRQSCSDVCSALHKSQRLSEGLRKSNKNVGGARKGSGRGKRGYYNGIWCDSSWELAFLIYHLDHGTNINRCNQKFSYTFEDTSHTYHPDFEIDGDVYEIKGVWTDKERAKLEQASVDINVIDSDSIVMYLEYAKEKHGADFIKVYDTE